MENFRTNVILPKKIVKEIDNIVGRRKRSDFLTEAAREKLEKIRFEEALEKTFGSWKDEDYPDLKSTGDIRQFLKTMREETDKKLQKKVHE